VEAVRVAAVQVVAGWAAVEMVKAPVEEGVKGAVERGLAPVAEACPEAMKEAVEVGTAATMGVSVGYSEAEVGMESLVSMVAGSCSTLRSRHYCGHRIESCVRYRRHRSCSGCRSSRRGQR